MFLWRGLYVNKIREVVIDFSRRRATAGRMAILGQDVVLVEEYKL